MFYLLSKAVSLGSGFVFPIYQSYKAIKTNDAVKMETWLMYWSVIGTVSIAEQTVEWLVNWIPFYYQVKMVAILWLTLPQIQGSSYVYLTYLHPFLAKHEAEIETVITEAKAKARAAGSEYLRKLWQLIKENAFGTALAAVDPVQQQAAPAQNQQQQQQQQKPGLLQSFSPEVYTAMWNFWHPMTQSNAPQRVSTQTRGGAWQPERLVPVEPAPVTTLGLGPAGSTGRATSFSMLEIRQRKAQLEQELAQLDTHASQPNTSASSASSSDHESRQASAAAQQMRSSMIGGQFDLINKEEAPTRYEDMIPRLWSASVPAKDLRQAAHPSSLTPGNLSPSSNSALPSVAERRGWFWSSATRPPGDSSPSKGKSE